MCVFSGDVLKVEPDRKIELDQLLDTAKTTLQKLEDTFAQNVDICPWIIHCYREILRINRNCRDLDKMLEASYFEDVKLVGTISTIRKELKREKAAKIARQVLELFESNCRQVQVQADGESDKKKKKKRDIGGKPQESPVKQNSDVKDTDCDQKVALSHVTGSSGHVAGSDAGAEGGVVETAAEVIGADGKTDCESQVHEDKLSQAEAIQTALNPNSAKAKDLCQTACRLLKEQIVKVHQDLEKKWQKLKDAGQLHVLGEDEEEEELEDEELDRIVAKAATAAGVTDEELTSPTKPVVKLLGEAAEPVPTLGGSTDLVPLTGPEGDIKDKRAGLGLDLQQTTPDVEQLINKVWEPPTPQTPAEIRAKLLYNVDGRSMVHNSYHVSDPPLPCPLVPCPPPPPRGPAPPR